MEETNRLLIREIEEQDYESLLKIYTKSANMKYILTGKYDWTMEELKEKWKKERYNAHDQTGFKVVFLKSAKEVIGECGLLQTDQPISKQLELAYLIDEDYWGQGLGTELCTHLIKERFERIETKKLIAGMYKDNVASAKIRIKIGKGGRFKIWHTLSRI